MVVSVVVKNVGTDSHPHNYSLSPSYSASILHYINIW